MINLQGHNEDLKELIFTIIRDEIIKEMRNDDIKFYDVRLLNGIYNLVNDTGRNDILGPLFDVSFTSWLEQYNDDLKEFKKK